MNTTITHRSSRLKWLAIILAVLVFTAFMILWRLTPLMKVDGQNVSFLGGLIEVNERSHTEGAPSVEIEGTRFTSSAELSGTHPVVRIAFSNAQLELATATTSTLSWDCHVKSRSDTPPTFHFEKGGAYRIDLASVSGAKCRISVPQGAALDVNGANGKISLKSPRFDAKVALVNGNIEVKPEAADAYFVTSEVVNGHTDDFPKAANANAHKLNLSVTNGRVINAR